MRVPKYPLGMEKRLDPEHKLAYGYFGCDKCNAKWYPGGGPARHYKWCDVEGFDRKYVAFYFGPNERMAREWVEVED